MAKLEVIYQVDLSELKEKVEKLQEDFNKILITIDEIQNIRIEFKPIKE